MKAMLTLGGDHQDMLTLTPETVAEGDALKAFAHTTTRPRMINCRGFAYMQSEVEFLIQAMPRND